jgi:ATP-dependent RNA helicase RhlE
LNFKDCNLIEPILKALDEQGYTEPTAIQAGAIRPALEGRDVLGIARTGTGKTCAFATPILQRLNSKSVEGRPIRALVLTPTRELAIQNQECFEAYSRYLKLRSVVIFGGVGQNPQVEAIQKGADILVATPGRLADLYQQKLLDLSRLEIFVLDEADRMLDMGFIHDVKKILKWLPQRKQTLFFSATMPKEITDLVSSLLHHPVRVAVDPVNTTVDAIEQCVYRVDRNNKTKLLVHLLREKQLPSVLVFTRTKHGANKVARDLEKAKISAAAIHGNKSQTARQQALADFKAGKLQVLVATDIAARGLDIEELSCVVNYNLSEVPETYVHRIGRTGRAGREGIAIALCDYQEEGLLRDIEKLIKKKIPVVEEHPWPMVNFDEPVRDKHGKVRNPEDEEARSAARERSRERKAAEKQVAQVKASQAAEKQPSQTKATKAQEPKASKKAPEKGKKSHQEGVGVVPIPDLLPTKEERALREQQNERSYEPQDILKRPISGLSGR